MPYRFLARERPGDAVARIAHEELSKSIDALERGPDRDEAIHTARLKLKKLRALLRLARPGLGEAVFQRENAALRDAAHRVSGARDAVVRLETLEALRFGGALDEAPALLAQLSALDSSAGRAGGALDAAIDATIADLTAARVRLGRWPLEGLTWRHAEAGVRRVYAQGVALRARAFASQSSVDFHDWRKAVKYGRHHIQLMTPFWPEALGETADAMKRLADLLGLDHDLWELDEAAQGPGRALSVERKRLRRVLAEKSAVLRDDARRLGRRLYAETPDAFRRRLRAYRRAWLAEGGDVRDTALASGAS